MQESIERPGLRDIRGIDIPWENPEVVYECPGGGYSVQRCASQWDYWLETYFLAHCLGTKDYADFSKSHVVYSLRDKYGIPHATILCVREDEPSPYGMCWDIGSYHLFTPEDERIRVLQVRGRNDAIAHPIFHALVREWYRHKGGRIDMDVGKIVRFLQAKGDKDTQYHFRFILDETTNHFLFTHWNHQAVRQAWWLGEVEL